VRQVHRRDSAAPRCPKGRTSPLRGLLTAFGAAL